MQLRIDRMSCKSRHGALSALIFRSATTFLLLIGFDGGQSEPMTAVVGDNITLPCHAKPATDAVYETLEWSRLDLNPRFVHVRRFGEDRLADQNPSYKGRTSLPVDRLKEGDVSLKLFRVKLSDEGTYRCFVPGLSTESSVQLIVGQSEQMMAMVGDNITLPCHVKPATDTLNETLEWSRLDLNPRFVHVRQFGEDRLADQNPSYKGRTSVSMERLKQGDVSLKLFRVKLSDEGTYRCLVPGLITESSVQLIVGAVIELDTDGNGVLHCESKGWYPEPEVLWLDGEGNVLSAGPTKTVKGPYDLYTVSSRFTVDKGHRNRFICKIQQNNINQSRETAIDVPDDFFTESFRSYTIIGVVFGILFVLVAAFIVWKWRQNRTSNKKSHVDEEMLSGVKKKNNVSSKVSEQELLIERETGKGQMEKLEKDKGQGKNNKSLNEVGHLFQTEDEIKQEQHMRQSETHISPVQRNRKCEEKSLSDNIQKEGETHNYSDNRDKDTKTKSVREETGSPCSVETGTDEEQRTEKGETMFLNSEQSDQGLINGNVQQPQVPEGQEPNDHKKKGEGKVTKDSVNNETAGDDKTDGKTEIDASPEGNMGIGMEQRPSPAETEGGQEERDDREKTTSVKETTASLHSLGGGTTTTNQHSEDQESDVDKEEKHEEKEKEPVDQAASKENKSKDSAADKTPSLSETRRVTKTDKEQEKSPESGKREASSKDSEEAFLMEKGTVKGKVENLKKEKGLEKDNKALNKEPGHLFQTEEEIKQEQNMRQSETNISPVQRNRKCEEKSLNVGTRSKIVMDDKRQQDDIQTEGETNGHLNNRDNDTKSKSICEETGSPCSVQTVTDEEQRNEKGETMFLNSEQSDQGQTNGNVQQPQVTEEQEPNDHKKKGEGKETTDSVNNETAGDDTTNGKTEIDASPEGNMSIGMEQRPSPAETEGGQEEKDDREKTTSVKETTASLHSLGGGKTTTNQHSEDQESDVDKEEKHEEKENEPVDQAASKENKSKDSAADKTPSLSETRRVTKTDKEQEKSPESGKREASSKDSEEAFLMEKGTVKGKVENLKKEKELEKDNKALNKEPGHLSQKEEQIKQEQHMRETETNNSPVQRNTEFEETSLNVGTRSKIGGQEERDDIKKTTSVKETEKHKETEKDSTDQGPTEENSNLKSYRKLL